MKHPKFWVINYALGEKKILNYSGTCAVDTIQTELSARYKQMLDPELLVALISIVLNQTNLEIHPEQQSWLYSSF